MVTTEILKDIPYGYRPGADPGFFLGGGAPLQRIPMNGTCGDDARRTSALTNRKANSPNFSAILPFLRRLT